MYNWFVDKEDCIKALSNEVYVDLSYLLTDEDDENDHSEYHIAYIPIDKRYRGFDYSISHPNVYGL